MMRTDAYSKIERIWTDKEDYYSQARQSGNSKRARSGDVPECGDNPVTQGDLVRLMYRKCKGALPGSP